MSNLEAKAKKAWVVAPSRSILLNPVIHQARRLREKLQPIPNHTQFGSGVYLRYWQRGDLMYASALPILKSIASRNDPSLIDAEKQIFCQPASVPYGPTMKPKVITEN
jgi:hypothetical protein